MRARGFTLLELLIVLAITAVVAAGLLLQGGGADAEQRLAVATAEVAGALRFARAEALRTGEPHGVRVGTLNERVRVYRLDTSGASPVRDYNVIHPVDKRVYDLTLGEAPGTRGTQVVLSEFQFEVDPSTRQSVSFAADGSPISPHDLSALTAGSVQLSSGAFTATVSVSPVTGRVTGP